MKNKKANNLLRDAAEVVYNRNSEKAQEYGPFHESMASAAIIATELTGLPITPTVFYKCMMALKLSRLKYSMKDDTFLDLLAYTGALHKSLEDDKAEQQRSIKIDPEIRFVSKEEFETINGKQDEQVRESL